MGGTWVSRDVFHVGWHHHSQLSSSFLVNLGVSLSEGGLLPLGPKNKLYVSDIEDWIRLCDYGSHQPCLTRNATSLNLMAQPRRMFSWVLPISLATWPGGARFPVRHSGAFPRL